jgi:hypothetical protein
MITNYSRTGGKTRFTLCLKPIYATAYAPNVTVMGGKTLASNDSVSDLVYTFPDVGRILSVADFGKRYRMTLTFDSLATTGSTFVRQNPGDVKTIIQVCVTVGGQRPDTIQTDSVPIARTDDNFAKTVPMTFIACQQQNSWSGTVGQAFGRWSIKARDAQTTILLNPFTQVRVTLLDSINVLMAYASAIPQMRYVALLGFEELGDDE